MSKRTGTITREDIERAKDNVLYFIRTADSPYNKNDIRGWFFVIYKAAKRKTPK